MNTYRVAWFTAPAVGRPFYKGERVVNAPDEQEAAAKARRMVAVELERLPVMICTTRVEQLQEEPSV